MMGTTFLARPNSLVRPERMVDFSTYGASPAGWCPFVDRDKVDPIPFALIPELPIEFADAGIICNTAYLFIPMPFGSIDILNTDCFHLVIVDQLAGNLVNIIKSLVTDMGLNLRYMLLIGLPIPGVFRHMPEFTLIMAETTGRFIRKMLDIVRSAITANRNAMDSRVNPNHCLLTNWRRSHTGRECIDNNACIKLPVRLSVNYDIFDVAMEAPAEDYAYVPALRNTDSGMRPIYKTVLRIMKRLSGILLSEVRIIRAVVPEFLKSMENLGNGMLKGLGINLLKPWIYFLQARELGLSSLTADTLLSTIPHHRDIIKCPVVHETRATKALEKIAFLFPVRVNTVPICP